MTQPISPPAHPADPVKTALDVARINGDLALLRQEINAGLTHVTSQLSSLQTDQRELTRSVADLTRHQQSFEAHSDGLERAFNAVEKLANEFIGWRAKHEADNGAVAERVSTFRGIAIGAGMLGALIVSVVAYAVKRDIEIIADEVTRLESKHDREHADVIRRLEKHL